MTGPGRNDGDARCGGSYGRRLIWRHCRNFHRTLRRVGSKVPHRLHGAGASELPHCWQKRAPWALTVPQLGQWTPAGLCGGKGFP